MNLVNKYIEKQKSLHLFHNEMTISFLYEIINKNKDVLSARGASQTLLGMLSREFSLMGLLEEEGLEHGNIRTTII